MSNDVRTVPLADLCELVDYGVTTSATTGGTGPQLLRITDIVPSSIDWQSVPRCDIDDRKALRFALRTDDIVVARTGATVGYAKRVRELPGPVVFASYLVRFRVDASHDARYVGYVVESAQFKEWVAREAGGAAQPNASALTLGRYPVPLPSVPSQRRIAALLAAFDELVAVNERRIELLEDLARSLYREWFESFRFPGHSTGPAPLPDWQDARIGDLADVVTDGVDPSDVAIDTPYCGLEHLPRRSTTLRDFGEVRSVVSRKLRFRAGDTLFGKIRPYFHKVVWSPFEGVASSDAIVFRAREGPLPLPALLTTILASDAVVAEAVATSNGTKMPRADPKAILNYRLALPPLNSDLLGRAEAMMRDSYDLAARLASQNHALARTRDLLLPRLVTGQLELSDVDLGALTPDEAA